MILWLEMVKSSKYLAYLKVLLMYVISSSIFLEIHEIEQRILNIQNLNLFHVNICYYQHISNIPKNP